MPGAEEELIAKLEDNIFMMDQLTTILDEDGPYAVFDQVLKGFEHHLVGESGISYRCYCSRERIAAAIECVSREELELMIAEDKGAHCRCHFCGNDYAFSADELREILSRKQPEGD